MFLFALLSSGSQLEPAEKALPKLLPTREPLNTKSSLGGTQQHEELPAIQIRPAVVSSFNSKSYEVESTAILTYQHQPRGIGHVQVLHLATYYTNGSGESPDFAEIQSTERAYTVSTFKAQS